MIKLIKLIGQDTRGATAVEYGLILALIFLAMIGAVTTFGTSTTAMWTNVSTKITSAISA